MLPSSRNEDDLSDEEVFFGKLTLKEVKKHILWNRPRECDIYDGLKIIETCSTPNLNRKNNIPSPGLGAPTVRLSENDLYSHWDIHSTDDSFLKVEQMVANLCVSPQKEKDHHKLDNTLDIVEYILNNGPGKNTTSEDSATTEKNHSTLQTECKVKSNSNSNENEKTHLLNEKSEKEIVLNTECSLKPLSPTKTYKNQGFSTPDKNEKQSKQYLATLSATDMKPKTPLFKTPANPHSLKKTTLKKTPSKNIAYQHIASPVASYIKNSPVTPLLKKVQPTKPLPGPSSIPKFVKNIPQSKPGNKENINLPSVAYKSAKNIKVIAVPDEDKLPKCQWMKKLSSSLPRPLVLKHEHRENNMPERVLSSKQEDSFANLSLHQADVSVCVQKSAYNKPKKLN